MDVQPLKALVVMGQHKVNWALGNCGVGLAVFAQLDLLHKEITTSTSAHSTLCPKLSAQAAVWPCHNVSTSSAVSMKQWAKSKHVATREG
jgi:hypothetical protein